MSRKMSIVDGNEAADSVAFRLNEVVAIYPITPSSPMGEWADQWNSEGKRNIWGAIPDVIEMQSEGGAAGALHGALQAGALGTTFTASQGLLLMIPNMYKIAGELTPAVIHVAARTLATHALSIFGDHSDVMSTRSTGFALLAANSVQEASDMACIAQVASLESRVPFVHFFDGFRTSHEVNMIEPLSDHDLRGMIDEKFVRQHRERAMTPDRPVLRGTAQNPDVFFQAREACNSYCRACPAIVHDVMDRFAKRTGRVYHLFEFYGPPRAERLIVLMGSGVGAAEEAVEALGKSGENLGLLGGVHNARDVIKCILAGAKAAFMTSALLRNGVQHAAHVLSEVSRWLDEHEYSSVRQMCGSMSHGSVPDPTAFERGNYMKVLSSYALRANVFND